MKENTLIACKDITKRYGTLEVLKGISLSVQASEVLSITGESGAGKSTLLHILGTLDKPDGGTVIYSNSEISGFSSSALADFRNQNIGFVFQFHQLLPEFTALENVCLPGWIGKRNKAEVQKEALELLKYLGLEQRAGHKPNQLSGGEQQRVSVARALINKPKAILADEPSGNLDSRNAEMLHHFFFKLRDDFGYTFIIVTHNPELAAMADRTIAMKDGLLC